MPKDPVPCVSVFTKWFPALHKFIWLIEMCKGGVHPYTKRTQKPKPLCKVSQLKVEFHHRKACVTMIKIFNSSKLFILHTQLLALLINK